MLGYPNQGDPTVKKTNQPTRLATRPLVAKLAPRRFMDVTSPVWETQEIEEFHGHGSEASVGCCCLFFVKVMGDDFWSLMFFLLIVIFV